jgi:hypothetical protein
VNDGILSGNSALPTAFANETANRSKHTALEAKARVGMVEFS